MDYGKSNSDQLYTLNNPSDSFTFGDFKSYLSKKKLSDDFYAYRVIRTILKKILAYVPNASYSQCTEFLDNIITVSPTNNTLSISLRDENEELLLSYHLEGDTLVFTKQIFRDKLCIEEKKTFDKEGHLLGSNSEHYNEVSGVKPNNAQISKEKEDFQL